MSNMPLRGLRVIEICNVASGPFCGMLLADMGADVIKIEQPETGDTMRSWPPHTEGYSENFASLNRNKRSIALDLKSPGDNSIARRLMRNADIVVENNRPGVMERLGLSYSLLSKENQKLIYCSISAYGQQGPRSQEAGFDLTIQAISGIMSVTGEPDGPPVKSGVPISDFATGLYAAFSIVSAHRGVVEGNPGTHIDISMLGSSLAIAALQTSQFFGSGTNPPALGSAHPRNSPYEVYECSDANVAIAAGNNGLFRNLCNSLGLRHLIEDPRFSTTTLRAQHQHVLKEVLNEELKDRTRQSVLELLRDIGVPCAPINNYEEALNDPQVQSLGYVEPQYLPNGSITSTFGTPVFFNGKRSSHFRPPPLLDEHRSELMSELEAAEVREEQTA